jgi:hypothetical protein
MSFKPPFFSFFEINYLQSLYSKAERQLVGTFPAFYKTQSFITVFTRVFNWTLSFSSPRPHT